MKVLVVGSGGREHALAWQCACFKEVQHVFVAPGNAGTALEHKISNVEIDSEDIPALIEFAKSEAIDITIVGPEAPLVIGIVDDFRAQGLAIFGPTQLAAQLEGSKAFCKDFLYRNKIPTAFYQVFTEEESAIHYVQEKGTPIVIKADGLAAGKGVIIANTEQEAIDAIHDMLQGNRFGNAGSRVVIEEFLVGEEASFIVMVDGKNILPMATSQDHKARDNGDQGPNTGGMGAYSPAPVFTDDLQEQVEREVLVPIVHGMAKENRPFSGVVYAGLMLTAKGPRVLEFNVRFGDPECQVLMARFKGDLLDVLAKCAAGKLHEAEPEWDTRPAVSIVMAQEGYPGPLTQGQPITNIDVANAMDDVTVFHAGTRRNDGGAVVASGGRVLNVTALGDDLPSAVKRAYEAVDAIDFPSSFCRRDIGHRALS